MSNTIFEACERCGMDDGALLYDDDGKLLCPDCIFEKNCEDDWDYNAPDV